MMMSVAVETEPTFLAELLKVFFDLGGYQFCPCVVRNYDIAPNGERFLLVKPVVAYDAYEPQMVVVENWFEEVKRLAPTD